MVQVQRPIKRFHLIPHVRKKTNNRHFVTWNGLSIIKEFKHNYHALELISKIYDLKLPNVEHGQVLAKSQSIEITRVGVKLSTRIKEGYCKEQAVAQIKLGIEQLHQNGYAHGDISLDNIFVDDANVVFLDDLEYVCLKTTEVPPAKLPHGRERMMTMEQYDLMRCDFVELEIRKL
jgi:serine/threonine protein kinase